MIAKGKSISHGMAALEYDLAKEINGISVATRFTVMSCSVALAKRWCRR